MNMKKAICFCRVSSNQQDLTAQREAVIEAIIKDGFSTEDIIYVEGKESAIKKGEEERVTLNELKKVVEANADAKDVYFFAIDRLARRVSIVLSIVDKMTAQGVNLHFLNPYPMQTLRNGQEDSMGKMFLTFLSIGAEMEMKMKTERFANVRKQMKAEGKIVNGKVYYGYRRDKNGYAVVCDEEAAVVRRIMSEYASGEMTLYTIAKGLVTDGCWKMGSRVTLINKVGNIIRADLYGLGQGTYQPICDRSIQEAAQRRLQGSRTAPKIDTKHTYLAKGRCYYHSDGGKLLSMRPERKNETYRTRSADYLPIEKGQYYAISIEVADMIAFDAAKHYHSLYVMDERWRKPQALQDEIEALMAKKLPLEESLETLKNERSQALKKAISKRLNDSDIDAIAYSYDEQINALTSELAKVQTQLELTQQMLAALEKGDNTIDTTSYDALDDDGKRKLVQDTIARVVCERSGKWEWSITAEPKLDLKIGIPSPTYIYKFAGGRKHLSKRVGGREETMI